MRRLPAGAGEPLRAGQHRRPPGELRRGGEIALPHRPHPHGRADGKLGDLTPDQDLRRGPGGGGLRRGRAHIAGRGGGADEARPGHPGRPARPDSPHRRSGVEGFKARNGSHGNRPQCH